MANENLVEIVNAIEEEELPEVQEDISDVDYFCEMVAKWVSDLNAVASDETGGTAPRGRSFVVQAMEREYIGDVLGGGLQEDVDTDCVDLYIGALAELKEMVAEIKTAFPRTYASAEPAVMRI